MTTLRETNFKHLGKRTVGKVRDIYEQSDTCIFITTDRHSSFDRIIAHVPHKGAVLNLLSAFWFEETKDIVQNHIVEVPDPNITIGKKCVPLPIECVVRGYITGSTNTSLWTLYKEGKRDFGNFILPDGMEKNQKLENAVFTPSTKSDAHDRALSPQEIVAEGILPLDIVHNVEKFSRALFKRGTDVARARGLILVDTKYEFGYDKHGALTLIDEIHTPDSSRYWKLNSYKERFDEGKEPEYFDKEFLRLWFKENSDPYNDEILPEAPSDMIQELSRRYIEIYEQLSQKKFLHSKEDPLQRISNAIKPYEL